MDSGFTLSIDWLAFTVLASNPQETMKVLGGDWSKAKGGFRGYPLSWMRADGLRGVGKLGTNAPRRPNEIHVDSVGRPGVLPDTGSDPHPAQVGA
jgi:phage replication initiation protein